jgi:glycosyltransferase involved in cell wall biosynthesis
MNMPPKTLVILTPAFPANESETHWVPTQQLFVTALKNNYPGLKIIIITFYYPGKAAEYEWHGLRVIGVDGTKDRKLKRIFFWNGIWKQIKRIRENHEVIGLFSFWCGECALIGHYFGRRFSIRHYCWLCGQDARKTNKWVKFIRPDPREVIAMSDFLVNEFHRNHGIRPRYMIPNAIIPEMFPPFSTGGRDIDILGVGSLSRLKRYDLFVGIVKALLPLIPGLRAAHCGDGEDRDVIRAMISKEGIEDHFALLGEKPYREALGLMQRARILLHTSEYEGFGLVCLEALYAGAHVISFCRPLNGEIPNWHIVRNTGEMISKAAGILLDPETKYEPVLPYTLDDTVNSIMKLFES